MTVAAHIVGGTGDTSYVGTDSDRLSLVQDSPDEAAQRQLGTKWFLIGWYTYIGLIWTLKMNMLFLYQRIVGHLWVRKFTLPAMMLVGTSAVAMWILLAAACRPFNHLWQIYPDPGGTLYHYLTSLAIAINLRSSILFSSKQPLFDNNTRGQPYYGFLYFANTYTDHYSPQCIYDPESGVDCTLWGRHIHHGGGYTPSTFCGRRT